MMSEKLTNKQKLRLHLISCCSFNSREKADKFAENVVESLSDVETDYLLDLYLQKRGGG